jgi:hypothetical protein
VIDARQQRTKPAALDRFAGGQRQRSHAAAVKAAEKRDDVLASGCVARQLETRFDRFSSRISEKRSPAAGLLSARRDRCQFFGEPDLRLVIKICPRHVEELLCLIDDGADDVGMRVPG